MLSSQQVAAERKETKDVMDNVVGDGSGERATGTANTIYDLSSVLFHALEGGASYDTYIDDAERESDEELAEFFRRVRDEDHKRADEAQRLLAERTPTTSTEGTTAPAMGEAEGAATSMARGAAAGVSPRTEPSSTPPGTAEELPPTRAGGTSPSGEGISPRPESSFAREGMEEMPRASGIEEGTLSRNEGTPPLESGRSGDLPGTEPIRQEDASTARAGEVPPPPKRCRRRERVRSRRRRRSHPRGRKSCRGRRRFYPAPPHKHHLGTCRGSHHPGLHRLIGEDPKSERREAC